MAKSDFLENSLLNHVLRGVAFPTLPASVYVALYTAAPTDSTAGTEVTGGAYARQAVTRGTGQWKDPSTATQGTVSNVAEIAFPVATANYPAAVVAVGLLDAATAGNLLYYGALTTSVTISQNGQFKFAAGALVVSES